MKNTIFLVIDSLNYTRMKETDGRLTPYLKSLEENYVSCENMYSQAPYTEAAVQSIYCGQNVLDNGGYIERYNKSFKTIFEAYEENGFDVYYNSFQPQCFPSSMRRGVTDIFCNVGYDLGALWHYRLEHYSKLHSLDKADEQELIRIFDDNFPEWLRFLKALENHDEEVSMIVDNAKNFDVKTAISLLENQIVNYQKNKVDYIYGVLTEKTKHPLFRIPQFFQDNKIKSETELEKIQEILLPTFKRIKKLNTKYNLKNNRIPCGTLFKDGIAFLVRPSTNSLKTLGKAVVSVKNAFLDPDLFERFNDPGASKNAPSLERHMQHFYTWLDKKNSNNPYFACIHVDDVHSPEQFFTYDSTDISRIAKQNKRINDYLDSLDKDYRGSITHDLSLIHIDNVIKEIFNEFKNRGILENSTVYIMADHGFAFGYNPIRTTFGIDFYLENYHIPFIVVDKDLKPKKIKELRASKDIPYTALSLSGIKVPNNFSGHSIFDKDGYNILGIEYCGSGCPDLKRRELMFGAFDGMELLGTRKSLYSNKDILHDVEYYDLINDPQQKKKLNSRNIRNSNLIEYINGRITTIKEYVEQND